MPAVRPRRRARSRRPSGARGTTVACALGGLALVGVMGVTVLAREPRAPTRGPPPGPAASVAAPAPRRPAPRVGPQSEATPLARATTTVGDVERGVKHLWTMERGPAFDRDRVDSLARRSTAREALGTWLDEHPGDDRANRLWDRLQLVYVLLTKL